MAKKTRKPKRRPNRITKLLKSIHEKNIHPELSSKKSVYPARLDAFQIAALERLAKEHHTTLAQEFNNAIVGYLLGMNQDEIRQLNMYLDRLNETMDRNMKELEAARRETAKTRAHPIRKKRSGRR